MPVVLFLFVLYVFEFGHLQSLFLMKILVQACRVERARPIIIDPGLYHLKKSGVFYAKERRSLPASFKLFMGKTPV